MNDAPILASTVHYTVPGTAARAVAALQLPSVGPPFLSILVQVPDRFHISSSHATSKPTNNKLAVSSYEPNAYQEMTESDDICLHFPSRWENKLRVQR
jgi:hypothetical protein